MTETADDQVEALCAEVWAWRLSESPELATLCGVHKTDDQLDDISEEAYIKREYMVQEFLKKAQAIDVSQTCRHKQSLLLLIDQLQEYLAGSQFKCYYFPISYLEGVHTDMMHAIEFMKFDTLRDFEVFVSRLEKIPKKVEQVQELLQKGIEEKMVMHRYSVDEVPAQLDKLISVPVEEHPFLKPFKESKSVCSEDLSKLKTRALDVLSSLVTPALQQLKQFLVQVYFKELRGSECVCSLRNGPKLYQQCLDFHLSCSMTPKEVHEIGLREVDRIRQQMYILAEKEGYGSVFEYIKHLKTKDEEKITDKDEILLYVKDVCHNKIRPKLHHLFKTLPLFPLEVMPCPEVMANSPSGFYFSGTPDGSRPGIYYINVHRQMHKYQLTCLSLHEGEPGHHLQSVYALAEKSLPDFRRFAEDGKYYLAPSRFSFNTAYTEGWGLYSEALGEEMGVYENSDSLMGRYRAEMFRAARLVVDTGIHAFGWSRHKAVTYMVDQMYGDYNEVLSEVSRYITWPGQACAYKIGELKLWELRHKAEMELGDDFELAEFHDAVLRCGAVPLRFLQAIIEDYIKDKKSQRLANEENLPEGQESSEQNSDK